MVGTAAGVGGARFIGVVAALANWPARFAAVALGGVAGALADSVLGATVQSRRWCELCATATERLLNKCGPPTRQGGGVGGVGKQAGQAPRSPPRALGGFFSSLPVQHSPHLF